MPPLWVLTQPYPHCSLPTSSLRSRNSHQPLVPPPPPPPPEKPPPPKELLPPNPVPLAPEEGTGVAADVRLLVRNAMLNAAI